MSEILVIYPDKSAVRTAVAGVPLLPDNEWGPGVPSGNTPTAMRLHGFDSSNLVATDGEAAGTLDGLAAVLDPDTGLPCVNVFTSTTTPSSDSPASCKSSVGWVDIANDG